MLTLWSPPRGAGIAGVETAEAVRTSTLVNIKSQTRSTIALAIGSARLLGVSWIIATPLPRQRPSSLIQSSAGGQGDVGSELYGSGPTRGIDGDIPCSSGAGGVGSIPANSDAQNLPSFRRWQYEMKLSPFKLLTDQLALRRFGGGVMPHCAAR